MNQLDGIIANNDLMLVKDTLDKLRFKLLKQDLPNKTLIKQLQDDTDRLESVYVLLNEIKQDNQITNRRNRDIESLLLSNMMWNKDLEKRNIDLEKQLKENKKIKEESDEALKTGLKMIVKLKDEIKKLKEKNDKYEENVKKLGKMLDAIPL